MSRHDKVRLLFCQQTVNDRTLISSSIIESSYYGLNVDSKKMFLDALAKDDQGEIYNIELQCYSITKNEFFRFQSYLFAQIIKQTKSGEKYEFKKVRQLIINNSTAIKGLKGYKHHFTYHDKEHGIDLPYSLTDITIFQTYYLETKITEKIIISDFEQIMYH